MRHYRSLTGAFTLLLTLVPTLPLFAQAAADRYEVGQHLRAFEEALDAQKDAAARRRALGPLKNVTLLFFSGQLSRVAETLDSARLDLGSDKEPEAAVRWAQSVSVTLASRLLDVHTEKVAFSLRQFYKAGERPDNAQIRLTLTRAGQVVGRPLPFAIADLPGEMRFPLKDLTEGDYILRSEVLVEGRVLAVRTQSLSLADRLDVRLEKLSALAVTPREKETTDSATVRKLATLLTALRDRQPQETDYPAARLLIEAEHAAAAITAAKPYYGQKRPGDFYLTLATKVPIPVRLRAPEAARKGEPLPLLIALHGAGGSENMFFETYGRGAAAQLAASRGWLIVSPRQVLPADLIDAVDALYPVDRRRVFVVGHSLGAAQAMLAVGADPQRYAAVAALGGSGRVQESDKLRDVPFFVGVGSDDFAVTAARGLKGSLEKAGVKKVTFKEYAGVEHVTVVQLALPDVFAFFDDVARGR